MAETIHIILDKLGRMTPADAYDDEVKGNLKRGVIYKGIFTQPRNYEFHKKYFAMLGVVFPNQEIFGTLDLMRDWLQCHAGFCDITEVNGEIHKKAKSISFGSMDETEFQKIYDAVLHVIITVVIPGLNKESLELEVNKFLSKKSLTG